MSVVPILQPEDREPPPSPATGALADCLAVYRQWLHLTSEDQVIAALGAVAANLLPGDPLWLLFVGAPGSGKTETIEPIAGLDYVHPAATFAEAALLSGTAKRDKESGATGGLLHQIGKFGIILAKDFSGVLSMHRDARAASLAALREVYDGSWTRPMGAAGGRVLSWSGKCGFIGAVTPGIDRHHAVLAALGERFVLYRMAVPDHKEQARRSLRNRPHKSRMRAELAEAVAKVLNTVDVTHVRDLDDSEIDALVDLATFVVTARSAVERDGYDRQVVVMPSPEAPGRLVSALGAFLAGLEAVGADRTTAWRIVTDAAWGCVPDMRRRLLDVLHHGDQCRTSELVTTTGIPKTPVDRTLEDLAMLGLVDRSKTADHDTAAWISRLSDDAATAWPASPEVSE
jgi:hypothetical protein